MAKTKGKEVTLPNGKVVETSMTEMPWWTTDQMIGYVPIEFIAPDPGQPREHMDPEELQVLTESVSVEGVVDPIVVTPRTKVPWLKVPADYEAGAFFFIVSGHRRRRAGQIAKLPAVPVRVRIYESEIEHTAERDDLNDNRSNLTAIEEARSIQHRLSLPGNTEEIVAKSKGMSLSTLRNRLALLQLAPDIQDRLNPADKKKKKGLATSIAVELGNLGSPSVEQLEGLGLQLSKEEAGDPDARRHAYQRHVLKIVDDKHLGLERTKVFISNLTQEVKTSSGTGSRRTAEKEPRKRRQSLLALLDFVDDKAELDIRDPEVWFAMFSPTNLTDIRGIIDRLATNAKRFESAALKLDEVVVKKSGKSYRPAGEILENKVTTRDNSPQNTEADAEDEPSDLPEDDGLLVDGFDGDDEDFDNPAEDETPQQPPRREPLPKRTAASPTKIVDRDEVMKRLLARGNGQTFPSITVTVFTTDQGYTLAAIDPKSKGRYKEWYKAGLLKWQREGGKPPKQEKLLINEIEGRQAEAAE